MNKTTKIIIWISVIIIVLFIIIFLVKKNSIKKISEGNKDKEKFISDCVTKFNPKEYFLNYQHILFTCERKYNDSISNLPK